MPDVAESAAADPGVSSAPPRRARRLAAEAWLHALLIGLVALAPLPLGSNRPLPAALLAALAGLLLLLWSIAVPGVAGRIRVPPRRILWPLMLYGAVCLWILLQALPWTPAAWADPIWRTGAELLRRDIGHHISVNPGATLNGLMNLLAYAAIFWLSLQLTRDADAAALALRAVIVIGVLYALYGIVIYVSGNEWILFYRKWAYPESLTSTFVNRNSFATFAGLCLLCAFGLFISEIRHLLTIDRPARARAVMILEHMFVHARWTSFALLTISIALLLSASRAGVAASGIALLFVAAIQIGGRAGQARQIVILSAIALAVLALVYFAAGNALSSRYGASDALLTENARFEVFGMVVEAISTAPLTGTGFGTFADVFSAYRAPDLSSSYLWDKAHNTFLENALELGIPATLMLNLALLLLALRAARGMIERRRNRIFATIGVAATLLVGLHSLVDFSLQIPAVSALYAYIMGLAVAQSWSGAR